jgi:DNA invertase Pin-like site-specific DNA recombinase
VRTYSDAAKSGASLFGRDGLLSLMADAPSRAFDVVLVENLDRISRDQEDIAGVYKRLTHHGIRIEQVHGGTADRMQIGLRGLLGSVYLADLAHKTKRGMEGRVREGKIAGGKPYGYAATPGRPGEFVIVEHEAEVVRRVFREYAAGRSPREIAFGLNADRVPAPRGAAWAASAINGGRTRQTGLLRVELYRGRIVWGKLRYSVNPDTGKRTSRPNPGSEWRHAEAPHLRIVDDELWDCVAARLGTSARKGGRQNRPRVKRLLSGLLRCGACGSGMAINGKCRNRYRVQCSRNREAGTCDHARTYYLDEAERIVVGVLQKVFLDPDAMQAFVEQYAAERRALISDKTRHRARAEANLAKAKAALSRLEDNLIYGRISPEKFDEVKPGLAAQIAVAEVDLAKVSVPPKIELHPARIAAYGEAIHGLAAVLGSGDAHSAEAIRAIREIVHSALVIPTPPGEPMRCEITGVLSALLNEDVAVMSVAGAGLRQKSYQENQSHRLLMPVGCWAMGARGVELLAG